jgi:hypothetical protein
MKTHLTKQANKLTRLMFAVAAGSLIITGCSSSKSNNMSEASGSSNSAMAGPRAKSTVGNLVALKHLGKTIYVDESSVEARMAQGDTFDINENGKTFYGDEKALQEYLK